MKGQAALLLVLLAASSWAQTSERVPSSTAVPEVKASVSTTSEAVSSILSGEPKDVLVENMHSDDDDVDNNEKIQEELAKVIKAQAKKTTKPALVRVPISKSSTIAASHGSYNTTDSQALKALLEAEDMVYNEDIDADDEDDDEDEYDDDDEDEDEDEDDDDDMNDDEEVMSGCPDYCRCVGQYAAATTARCSKLLDDQGFGSGIAHLKIENAGDIRLGPHALRKLGLRQLESISIVDTKIVELDRTAFDGLKELFVVNLTRNGLTNIHPDTFQNNSGLSLLTIANNPLKLQASKRSSSDYLLDAPSVTELDVSGNQLSRLPKRAFSKMTNLAYISLKNNRLNYVDEDLFAPLDSLVELDLSQNSLSGLPADLFKDKGLQTLRISGNKITSLKTIKASKLTTLDVSMNRLKLIVKDDLAGVPYLDQLYLSDNNLKRIHSHAFADLDQLTYLDLSTNNLGNLGEHHFRTNSRLQVLLLSNNPDLETLPVFRTNAQEFERYSIYRFECENCGLTFIESGTFDAMPAMTRLNLAHNKLTNLPKDLLRSLSSLRELDLSKNRFDKLEDDVFEGATSLTKLNLAMNSFVSGLRVTPFLKTPNLARLDASFCNMQRVWSEARLPFKSLRFLSLHKNRLTRITVEELRAMPQLSVLDISRNPLRCDEDLSAAVQWLTDNNVTPTESTRSSNGEGFKRGDYDYEGYATGDTDAVSQWTDLAKKLCDSWEGGPPPRPAPKKPVKKVQSAGAQASSAAAQDSAEEGGLPSLSGPFIKFDFSDDVVFSGKQGEYGQGHSSSASKDEEIENAWNSADQEYEELANVHYREWYTDALWPVVTVVLITLAVLLLCAHVAVCLAKRRGRGPVIRTPMILRPGLIDSKNCGLVYKPLQEEIATPHMPKRGSFYSSSTFHYDKIVPESV
ncbi:insulin-like growth factor-binding protein complex acid labile subunit isoform X2 [Nasonia vitripennis]|nr:insulin-like growth factor-binding protein complex acid labile subunit isoform X2 [Nasonia vitripennis]XP_031780758.1 insulin-like growth factor-binding protein complex acid labile subunit isoform X2 [Nasonia vitripennis]XP_031780759.1 insulin-like growth factor-binding protein complex acid labile subunit isoform X2 [Nasonia vitripennis]